MAEHSGAGVIEGESVKRSTRHLTLSLDQLNADAAAFDGFDPDVAVSDRSRLILNGEMSEWSIEHAWKAKWASNAQPL